MLLDTEIFKSHFDFSAPPNLVALYSSGIFANSLPVGFRFNHVGFVVEVQYLLDVNDPQSDHIKHKRLPFAVTTDGLELMIDLNTENLEILQSEYGDIDNIGITVKDLKEAETYSL